MTCSCASNRNASAPRPCPIEGVGFAQPGALERPDRHTSNVDRNTDICFSACVRTTLDIEENLYRRVKAKAAMEGRTVTELVEAGLRSVMETPPQEAMAQPAWKRFAGVWSGPGWDDDRKRVDAEMEAAFGSLEPEDQMSAAQVEASWKPRP